MSCGVEIHAVDDPLQKRIGVGDGAQMSRAHKLARRRRKGERLSLREISTALADAGHTSSNGSPFTATSVQRMLSQ